MVTNRAPVPAVLSSKMLLGLSTACIVLMGQPAKNLLPPDHLRVSVLSRGPEVFLCQFIEPDDNIQYPGTGAGPVQPSLTVWFSLRSITISQSITIAQS